VEVVFQDRDHIQGMELPQCLITLRQLWLQLSQSYRPHLRITRNFTLRIVLKPSIQT